MMSLITGILNVPSHGPVPIDAADKICGELPFLESRSIPEQTCASLRAQISATEAQLAGLRRELQTAEQAAAAAQHAAHHDEPRNTSLSNGTRRWPLDAEEYRRYGRQMIVPQLGIQGQLELRSSRVLLVGAGGLGCPAALYLAGAGVGTIGLIDGDTVESSNLHRQVLHQTKNVGKLKVDSAIEYLKQLNPHPTYVAHRTHLTPQDAPQIFQNYDLILDCTDNPATRYLISDTAVLLGKPLVSASALRTEGQLMVLNNPPRPPGDTAGGPCYRCVFPKPPPAASVVSCADGGILGPVVGTMGVLQALEAIKVLSTLPPPATGPGVDGGFPTEAPSLLIFSAYSSPPFRSIRLRSRRANCAACSANATVTLDTIISGSTDYVFFCGSASPVSLLSSTERITPLEFRERHLGASIVSAELAASSREESKPPILIDVREKVQFDICSLDNSINVPISKVLASKGSSSSAQGGTEDLPAWIPAEVVSSNTTEPIYVVCRLGNDSQIAVQRLKELGLDHGGTRYIGDIKGGLRAWREQVDPEWPEY